MSAHKAPDHATLSAFESCAFVPGTDVQGRPATTRIKITHVRKIA